MNLQLTQFDADKSSLKVVQTIEDSITISNAATASSTKTYTNQAQTVSLITSGMATITITTDPTYSHTVPLPFTSPLEEKYLSVRWDASTIYVEYNNQGVNIAPTGGTTTATYKILVCIP